MPKYRLTLRPPPDIRVAWIVWTLFAAVASALVLWPGLPIRSITYTYRSAALYWFQGEDLYTTRFRGFVYLPQAALLYSPLAFLPLYLNEIIWRFLCVGLLASAVWRLAKWAAADGQWFPLVSGSETLTGPGLFGSSSREPEGNSQGKSYSHACQGEVT